MDKQYKINMVKGTITAQFKDIFQEILARKVVGQVEERVNKAVDREISKVFQRIARDIFANDFVGIESYLPSPWKDYASDYAERKEKDVGHLNWFLYGKRRNKAGKVFRRDPLLANYLAGISPAKVLNRLGETQAKVSKDNKKITITVAPNVSIIDSEMEKKFSTVITPRQMAKLKNRRGAYRSLVGPEFLFMLNERIPQLVERSLGRF